MQDICKYISGLLFIHDCVILPGFGGFITNNRGAEFDESSHTFIPPKKDIVFNKEISYNDGLLINYLAKNLNITYAQAETKVRDEVQRAWLELEKNREIKFEDVGVFRYDKNDKLIFEPDSSLNFSIDSYGLTSFRFPPLSYQKDTQDIIQLNNITTMDNTTKTKVKWAVAATVLLIIGVSVFFPLADKINEQVAGYSLLPNDNPVELAHITTSSDTNMSEVINKNTDKRTALFYTEDVVLPKKQDTKGYKFYIIGGSFKKEVNAKQYIKQYKDKGFDIEILNVDGLYRVSLKSFDSKVKALHELRRIRNEEQNDKVWLLSYK